MMGGSVFYSFFISFILLCLNTLSFSSFALILLYLSTYSISKLKIGIEVDVLDTFIWADSFALADCSLRTYF